MSIKAFKAQDVDFEYRDLLIGEVIRAAFEYWGYTCFDKPYGLWWMPDGVWYLATCARSAS